MKKHRNNRRLEVEAKVGDVDAAEDFLKGLVARVSLGGGEGEGSRKISPTRFRRHLKHLSLTLSLRLFLTLYLKTHQLLRKQLTRIPPSLSHPTPQGSVVSTLGGAQS